MSSFLLSRIVMGTILTFRYVKPGAGPITPGSTTRDVLVIAPNYLGNLHGLKISHLTPSEQEYLQLVFRTLYVSPQDFFEPLIENLQKKKEELEAINNQANTLLQQAQAYVVKPAPTGLFGSVADKGRQIAGSIIGKVRTFGRTQAQAAPRAQIDPNIQMEVQKNNDLLAAKKAEFDQYAAWVKQQQQTWIQVGRVPSDPYSMYHGIIKPLIGGIRMPQMYRKYNVNFIKSPRIVRSPGIIMQS